jgi:hypothetical protein
MRLVAVFAGVLLPVLLAAPAWGQAVTLADLDGAFVELKLKSQVEGRRNGKPFTSQPEADWKIVLGPGNTGFSTSTTITQGEQGTRVSDPRRGSFTLGRPGPISSLGGGYYLWTFENGTLTFLRTYKAGGQKTHVSFTRSDGGLACTVQSSYAREVGIESGKQDSAYGGEIEITGVKPLASTCRVVPRWYPPSTVHVDEPYAPKPGGKCFVFDGRQFCE